MANDISKYHGEVSECTCGINGHPERQGERACGMCFGRGFVAKCKSCDGNGQISEKVAGGPGMMKSTCTPCGGHGFFGVRKPDWWCEQTLESPTGEVLEIPSETATA